MRRVVITGMGVISCLGSTLDQVTQALRHGVSGVVYLPERKAMGFRSALAGVVKPFSMPPLPKGQDRQMNRNARMAIAATVQAIADAGLAADQLAGERNGAIVGNVGNMEEIFQLVHLKHQGKKSLPALAMARTMNSTVSANLSILYGLRGQVYTVSAACASGAAAIGQATQLIALGKQDRMIAAGVQDGSWEFDCLFEALRVFSSREDEPTRASRPFDRDRDGLVPAGACGVLILEEYEAARRRGARIRAEVIGYGVNADGSSMTTPSGDGSMRCMEMALSDAGIAAAEVDYVNAHATATPVGDAMEAKAIRAVFGDRPWVSSTKSMTGHEIGAAGATEVIYTLLMLEHGFVAPTINLEHIDEDCQGIRHVANQALEQPLAVVASNSSGFGGVNTTLILRKVD